MTTRGASSVVQRSGRVLGKVLVAVIVFTVIVAGYSYGSAYVRRYFPLPDEGPGGAGCPVWLVGSSSMHRWTGAARDLPGWSVHNRGIEGARLGELIDRLGRTTPSPAPAAIVFYAGENDLAAGEPAEAVSRDVTRMVDGLRRIAPDAPLYLVSMKPSPTRWQTRAAQLAVDADSRRLARRLPNTHFVEAGRLLLVAGRPGDFYGADGIHLSSAGYTVWGAEVARHLGPPAAACGAATVK